MGAYRGAQHRIQVSKDWRGSSNIRVEAGQRAPGTCEGCSRIRGSQFSRQGCQALRIQPSLSLGCGPQDPGSDGWTNPCVAAEGKPYR